MKREESRKSSRTSTKRDNSAVELCSDSTYAINVATGKWVARKRNQELGRRLRNALAELRKTRGYDRVRLRHIYSHTRDRGNETADRLAKAAARTADFSGDGAPVLRLAQETFEESGAPSSPATARPQQVHVVDQTLGQELGDG